MVPLIVWPTKSPLANLKGSIVWVPYGDERNLAREPNIKVTHQTSKTRPAGHLLLASSDAMLTLLFSQLATPKRPSAKSDQTTIMNSELCAFLLSTARSIKLAESSLGSFGTRTTVLLVLAWTVRPAEVRAATVWTGPTISFSKAASADPTQSANQDHITDHVWLTRGSIQGIYNAKIENSFVHFLSPADTEWASGTTAIFNSLTYTDWNTWAKVKNPGPPSTVGVNAVLHLKSDDIYLDIKFTSW